MKAKIALILPALALLGASLFALPKAVEVRAEGEPTSSEVPTTSEETSSEPKKFNVNEIIIDGKTIEQWKNELKDENTRVAAIIGLIAFAAGGFLLILKWVTEHNLLIKTRGVLEATKAQLEEQKAKLQEKQAELEEKMKQVLDSSTNLKDFSDAVLEEAVQAKTMLDTIMKTDPTLVANNAYMEAKKALEEIKNGKGQ